MALETKIMTPLRWLLVLLLPVLLGWTRPDRHDPVILIEQMTACQQYPWDTRPCQMLMVQNGFAGWEKVMTIEDVNRLIATLDETTCYPEHYTQPANHMWQGIVISPVDPFGGQAIHYVPTRWEVRCD